MEEEGVDEGFGNVEDKFKDLENQANQTDASLQVVSKTSGRLLKSLIGMGVAGVAAMTALAVKSPVLAGTMAKIEVETLKLSNTIGRQLRPVFESIAGNLIPAINSAFTKNSESIGLVVDKVVALVDSLSDLLNMDWPSLLSNLEKYFDITSQTPEEKEAIQSKLGKYSEFETSVGLGKDILSDFSEGKIYGPALKAGEVLPITGFIDLMQYLLGTNNEKERAFITANGVPR